MTITQSQRTAARVVGFLYLLLMASSIIAQVLSGSLITGDAAQTATNILGHETLFRSTIALNFITFAADAVLAAALYILFKSVNPGLALLGAFWRVSESTLLIFTTVSSLNLLQLLNAAPYMKAFTPDQLQVLARWAYGSEVPAYNVGFFILALGGLVFAYLMYQSRYIPRSLSALGALAYGLMILGIIVETILPAAARVAQPIYFVPTFLFEVIAGFWLVIKGVDTANWGWFSRTP